MVDRDEHLPGLDDRLERVGVLRDDVHRDGGLAVVGAEARGRVGHVGPRGAPHHGAAHALEALLDRREVLELRDLAVADHHVGAARDDRLDQLRDVARVVLVVGVGVHDDVGAELEARVEPGLERGGEALVVREPDDVVDAVRARDVDRAVGRAVVDHEPLDRVDAGHLAGEVGERLRELLFLVLAGDLDDELQSANCVRRSRGPRGRSSRARASGWRSNHAVFRRPLGTRAQRARRMGAGASSTRFWISAFTTGRGR